MSTKISMLSNGQKKILENSLDIVWKIQDFDERYIGRQSYILGPEFSFRYGRNKWQYELHFSSGNITVKLALLTDIVYPDIEVEIKTSVIGMKFLKLHDEVGWFSFTKVQKRHEIFEIDYATLMRDRKSSFIGNDIILHSYCRIDKPMWSPSHYLRTFQKEILKSSSFSDVTILVKGTKFRCHKAILSCRSQFFKTVLQQHDITNDASTVVFDCTDPNTFRELLNYIYTDHVEISDFDETFLWNLLVASEEYCLPRLTYICEKGIMSSLCLGNIDRLYRMAITYNTTRLVSKIVRISEYFKAICDSPHNSVDVNTPVICPDLSYSTITNNEIGAKIWLIENFKQFVEKRDKQIIDFPSSDADGESLVKWQIETTTLFDLSETESPCLALSLKCLSYSKDSILCGYTFYVLNGNCKKVHAVFAEKIFQVNHTERLFMKLNDIENDATLLHNGNMLLGCTLSAQQAHLFHNLEPVPKGDLKEDLLSLLDSGDYCDFLIKVDGELFRCHKVILQRSSIFADMVKDSSSEIFEMKEQLQYIKELLTAIYSGQRLIYDLSDI